MSRILQNALAFLLTDQDSIKAVDYAWRAFSDRRAALVESLAEHGVTPLSHDGLVMALPVRDDAGAQLVLAAHGYAVTSSELTRIKRQQPFIRVTVGALSAEKIPAAAAAIAIASEAPSPHLA